MLLSEARSNLAADRENVRAQTERVKWIMFQDMCALIVVRNAVLEDSDDCLGNEIVDCDVDFWVGKQCTVRRM